MNSSSLRIMVILFVILIIIASTSIPISKMAVRGNTKYCYTFPDTTEYVSEAYVYYRDDSGQLTSGWIGLYDYPCK